MAILDHRYSPVLLLRRSRTKKEKETGPDMQETDEELPLVLRWPY